MGVIVIKLGGSLQGGADTALAGAVQEARRRGWPVVLVHGGGPRISKRLRDAGIELPFVNGLRQTTDEAMPHVMAALAECNRDIAETLARRGVPVAALADGEIVVAKDVGRLRTGDVAGVRVDPIQAAVSSGRVPVIAPFGRDAAGQPYNINADHAASHIARALGATRLVFLTDVPGIYRDFEAGDLLLDTTPDELEDLLQAGAFNTGMIPKVNAVLHAVRHGVREVWVVDGRDPEAVQMAALGTSERRARGTRLAVQTEGVTA
ncbi:acetylglutamate kinase [Alicyclobacillus acidocaldarius]|uniref:acetylglutamate kinase n=1 Tax=Alicyclobacillus acidocaldarius (strain Tc-4-1) TaxID=1048834 RepID=F8IGR4_ALIAT|nr:acetylglutamate kinase [Alicyclobacillus acidocaldarius]AEJ43079.1 acetylglutamate kinase [Alicyclobacillus acidocaldarius subsp. acidocaldarius Tc-4-1]